MSSTAECYDAIMISLVGPVGVRLHGETIAEIGFLPAGTPKRVSSCAAAAEAVHQLQAYFSDPHQVPNLPLMTHGTLFQQRVWQALRTIPVGQVLTCGALAQRLGSAPRAVGGACRANPWPILVPCHRVVAARGPGGYGGATQGHWLAIKARLLCHEGVAWPL